MSGFEGKLASQLSTLEASFAFFVRINYKENEPRLVKNETAGLVAFMTNMPTTGQFRAATAVALVSWVAMVIFPSIGIITFSEGAANARMWNYFDAGFPLLAIQIWWGVSGLLMFGGLIGLLFFWRPSRWMLLMIMIANIFVQPLLGLVVYSPFEASMAAISGTLFVWLTTMSFWSPLSTHFRPKVAK